MQLPDGSFVINPDDQPWLPLGEPGNFMKILHIDEDDQQVVFMQRFGKDTQHPKHTHHCTAVAFTLTGEWAYDGRPFPTGSIGYEPYGSTHTPMTQAGNTADVLVVLTSRDGRFIEMKLEDGSTFELNMDVFKEIAAMSVDEALAQQREQFPDMASA